MPQKLPVHEGYIFAKDGYFSDNTGASIVLFGVRDFDLFWGYLDTLFESPMGRKLIYAGTDAEELILSFTKDFRMPRFFGAKKVRERLQHRWIAMGWGLFSYQKNLITMPCHDAWSVGLALAHREHLTQERWTMSWTQRSSEHVELQFEPKAATLAPVQQPRGLHWGAAHASNVVDEELDLDLEARSYGFFRGQQRSFFMHVSAFQHLYNALIGRPLRDGQAWVNEWTVSGTIEAEIDLFKSVAHAAQMAFQQSEVPIFVQQPSDWIELFSIHLSHRGLGHVVVKSSILDGEASTEFSIHSSLPAVTCGVLAGMFERAHGQHPIMNIDIHPSKLVMNLTFPSVDYAVKT